MYVCIYIYIYIYIYIFIYLINLGMYIMIYTFLLENDMWLPKGAYRFYPAMPEEREEIYFFSVFLGKRTA